MSGAHYRIAPSHRFGVARMTEDISWFEMAEQFEAVDPWGLLEMYWLFRKETHDYLYSVRLSSASPYVEASEPHRTKPTVMRERFTALCARSSRKLGLSSGTPEAWLAEVSIGHRVTSFDGAAPHPTTKAPMAAMTGTISNIAQRSAALCYKIDASPEKHGEIRQPSPARINPSPTRQPGTVTNLVAAQRAREYMQANGLTQVAFGKRAGGISDRTIRSFLKTGTIRKGLLPDLAKAMKTDVDSLLLPDESIGNKAESKRKN